MTRLQQLSEAAENETFERRRETSLAEGRAHAARLRFRTLVTIAVGAIAGLAWWMSHA
jgi:hypothetical protein